MKVGVLLLPRFLFVCCVIGGILFVHTTYGAYLYLEPGAVDMYRGDTAVVDVRIDTDEGECISVVHGVILYGESVRAEAVSTGKSILNKWVENPTINESEHTVSFAGGIPGGYCGRIPGDPSLTNILAQIVFRSPGFAIGMSDKPTAEITIDPASEVLLNDGFGTSAQLRTTGTVLNLLPSAGPKQSDTWNDRVASDNIPPADFSILFPPPDDNAFGGRYFISFESQDKQSGIDHYEVMEEPLEDLYAFKWGRVGAPWTVVTSPYILKDQTLNSTIRVKAVDRAGNATISVLVPDATLRTMSDERLKTLLALGALLVVLMSGIGYLLIRRRNRLIALYAQDTTQEQ